MEESPLSKGGKTVQNVVVARMNTQVIPIEATGRSEKNTEPAHKLLDLDTISIRSMSHRLKIISHILIL